MESSNIVKLTILFVILAILGFNIFTYLAKGTDILGSLFKTTGKTFGKGANKTLDYVGIGTKTLSKGAVTTPASTKQTTSTTSSPPSNLSKAVNQGPSKIDVSGVTPDSSADSTIQSAPKKGFCYVGTDRGFRSCISIIDSTMCASGKIFPTHDLCINPTLRQ